ICGNANQTLFAGDSVEATLVVASQATDKIVTRRGSHLVGDAFVIVRLTVVVQVDESRDLVAAKDVDLVVANDKSERLMQAGRKTPPTNVFEFGVQAGGMPNVAGHCR